jgi:hypothetical protein
VHFSIVTLLGMAVIATAEPYNIPILNSANGALAETLEAVGNNAGLLGDVMVSIHTDLHM